MTNDEIVKVSLMANTRLCLTNKSLPFQIFVKDFTVAFKTHTRVVLTNRLMFLPEMIFSEPIKI